MSKADSDFLKLSESEQMETCESDKLKMDEYKIIKRLGGGSYGNAYLATKRGVPGNFVLKEMTLKNQNKNKDGVDIIEVYSEINVLKKIANGVCKEYFLCYREHFMNCSDQDDIKVVIVTDAFDNAMTLFDFINKRVLPVQKTLNSQYYDLLEQKDKLEESIEDLDETETEHFEELQKRLQNLNFSILKKKEQIDSSNITPLSHKILLTVMFNVLKAMYSLHEMNIAHGDLKPENILINPDTYKIQIIDFGLSCFTEWNVDSVEKSEIDTNKSCNVRGTVNYNSPEMLNNMGKKSSVDFIKKADVFSLGVIFFKLANGTYPYHGKVDATDPKTIIVPLVNFYKNSPDNILSMYNQRHYPLDEKINDFIEMFFEKVESRPKLKDLMFVLQDIIDEYNDIIKRTKSPTTPTIDLDIQKIKGSPIKYTDIDVFPSPVSPDSPDKQMGGFNKVSAKYPRKWSKDYCKRTSCDKMGFSQRASCRYYKNCYK